MLFVLTVTEMANSITSFGTLFSGLFPLLICLLYKNQPKRWIIAYLSIFLSGIITYAYHTFGEGFLLHVGDWASNLAITGTILIAMIGDGFDVKLLKRFTLLLSAISIISIVVVLILGENNLDMLFIKIGTGGYFLIEIILLLSTLGIFTFAFMYWKKYDSKEQLLLIIIFLLFLIGGIFSTADNHEIWFEVFPAHATWHMIHTFAFITLWKFNEIRFNKPEVLFNR